MIEIQCHLEYVDRDSLDEAVSRNVQLVVGPLRGDMRMLVETDARLSGILVSTDSDPATTAKSRREINAALSAVAYRQGAQSGPNQPLQYNFAREFPLDNPFLTRYHRVYRQSVRDLLRTFERRNGVRLWCSVRRSGKTTAGFDLGSTTTRSTVITQTCDSTGQAEDDGTFYRGICDVLAVGRQLSSTFFAELVSKCGVAQRGDGDRIVFVLDEYETFFGKLRSALRVDPDIRYPVVQPLLNQMVGFSRENLLVFLGQQPDAHYILMDQNQLTPHVSQDSFPLFTNNDGEMHEEFAQLVDRVLTTRIRHDQSFIRSVFGETAGHPFLTVKLLVHLVDWLIARARPAANLTLTEADFHEFSASELMRARVSVNREYMFFRRAAAEAMSEDGRGLTPWLNAVYACLSAIGRESPTTFSVTRDEFRELAQLVNGRQEVDPDLLLADAARSNFLDYDDHHVWPKIRLLSRIAAVSHRIVLA